LEGVADGEVNGSHGDITPPPPPGLVWAPVELITRDEDTWLVLLPLNRLLASTPLSKNEFEVSACRVAQIGAFPNRNCAGAPLAPR